MQITSFRVQKYRNIQDSGWVRLGNLTAIVGKNESGKTALLRALHKFNPFRPEPYSMDREWPRGQRRERDPQQVVCSVQFKLSKEEKEELTKLTGSEIADDIVTVVKNYAGQFEIEQSEKLFPDKLHPNDIDKICELLPIPSGPVGENYLEVSRNCSEEAKRLAYEGRFSELAALREKQRQTLTASFTPGNPQPQHQHESQHLGAYMAALGEVETKLKQAPSIQEKAHEFVISKIPTFIYMDEYRAFTGSAQLDQVLQRMGRNNLTEEDKTLLMILNLSGLTLEEEVTKGNSADREQRQYDLDDASVSLTNLIEGRWQQRKYEVQFRADGQHFYTMVKDDRPGSGLIPLEERSKGFQWFFSFDLLLMHESRGTFEGCVILLDEPGLHLHPDAQTDFLRRLEAYAQGNALVYSTHLPFMLDLREPDRIRIISEREDGTAYVTEDLTLGKPEEKLTLQAALGMKGRQSYLVAQRNLVVEGVDDYMVITELSNLMWRSGLGGLPEDIIVTAAGGASEAVYISTFMIGQELEVVSVFDSDDAGRTAEEKLRKKWLTLYKGATAGTILLAEAVGLSRDIDFAIEDIFPESYYLEKVKEVYGKQIAAGGKGALKLQGDGLLCDRVESALKDYGVEHFNKGSVAKRIRTSIRQMKSLDDLPADAKDRGQKVITAIVSKYQSKD